MIKYNNLDLENFEKHYIYLVILREVFFSTHQTPEGSGKGYLLHKSETWVGSRKGFLLQTLDI